MNETLILEAVEAVLSAREFFGNAGEAIFQVEEDNQHAFTVEEKCEIYERANGTWREYQKEAGVRFPLTNAQRAQAFKDIESGK